MTKMTCVIRNISGIDQFVPANETFNLQVNEPAYTGNFLKEQASDGPSKSHKRTICKPQGHVSVSKLTSADVTRLTNEARASINK